MPGRGGLLTNGDLSHGLAFLLGGQAFRMAAGPVSYLT
jgi:hypothetical protein